MITIEGFNRFRERYERLRDRSRASFTKDFVVRFHALSAGYEGARVLFEERNRKTAMSFNIFSILKMGSYEVRTHTPFLTELLDVKGSHGQGNLFLCRFLNEVLGFSDVEASDNNWYVISEKEYIDLRLINHSLRKAVFIENKVDTVAHSYQLSRYYKKWEQEFCCNGAFVYLSPSGEEPPDSGFDPTICRRSEVKLTCISYREDIAFWLNGLIEHIAAHKVRETVRQYIDLITSPSWS
jgi:hypothetical protein